jgi:radical SAM protein (TIGR01212 family)
MQLADYVTTYGQYLQKKYGHRVHKISVDAQMTCPHRHGEEKNGGCTFCNNLAFAPDFTHQRSLHEQIELGSERIRQSRQTDRFIIYFQTYSNTHAELSVLEPLYRQVLHLPGVIGLSIGTRPDCVSDEALDLLATLRAEGYEICLELGLQTAHNRTLESINRGHTFEDFCDAITRAKQRDLQTCAHLILGLPGETPQDCLDTLTRVIASGTDGAKLHPLHIVRETVMAEEWKRGEIQPLSMENYVALVCDLIRLAPSHFLFHRLTATAHKEYLLAPEWCLGKWKVLNEIAVNLAQYGRQGDQASSP